MIETEQLFIRPLKYDEIAKCLYPKRLIKSETSILEK